MGRDPKLYRLLQDSRHGRVLMAESEDIETMVDAVTNYVARRLLERDKALAADMARGENSGRARPGTARSSDPSRGGGAAKRLAATAEPEGGVSESRLAHDSSTQGRANWLMIAFAFLIDLLGSIAFFTILAAIGWYVWNRMHIPI